MPGAPPKKNQDIFFIDMKPDQNSQNRHYFGVCDGHGVNGHFVSGYLKIHLPMAFKTELAQSQESLSPKQVIEKSFQKVSDKLLASKSFNMMLSGSTAVTCFMDGTTLYVANVGDSRCIIVRKVLNSLEAQPLSRDQKVDDPIEKPRLLAGGGRVEPYRGISFLIRN